MDLFRRKSVTALQAEAAGDHRLKRALGPVNLTALGIGAIIGTGIFVLTGTVAAQNAGPAVILSFVLAGVASVFAALCYSEFASLVPMAGSAYTYGYATLGEFVAWIIGWDLVLEYALSRDHGCHRLVGLRGLVPGRSRHPYPGSAAGRPGDGGNAGRRQHQVTALLQSAGCAHHRGGHHPAGGRHQGVGLGQQRHRVHQAGRRAPVHRAGRVAREPGQLAPVHPAEYRGAGALRLQRRGGGSGDRVLRLHRIRCGELPRPRRPKTRSGTCRSASSGRW